MNSFFYGFEDELEKIAKSFPISRAMTSSYNPIGLFGLKRFVGSRGLMDRLAIGTVTKQDHRSIRRILMSKKNMSEQAAGKAADKILNKAKGGGFSRAKGGKEYFVSGALSGRRYAGAGGMLGGGYSALHAGFSPATAAAVGAVQGAHNVGVTQLWRALGPRGLAGRIAKGNKLTRSEQKLMSMIDPSAKRKVMDIADKLKSGANVSMAKLKSQFSKK